jgi:imidazolonepropionase-like amidohydrolase
MRMRLLTAAALLALVPAAPAQELVVKAAKVYTLTGAPLAPGAVHVRDGKVVAVAAEITAPAGVKVIDLGSGVLIPGLVDAHTSRGVDGGQSESTREVTPEFRVLDAVDWSAAAFRVARAEGTTTVGLVPGTDNVVAGLSCVVKTAGDPANRVVRKDNALVITLASDPSSGNLTPPIGNPPRPIQGSIYVRQPTNRMGVVWMLRSELIKAKDPAAKEGAALRAALDGKRPVTCVSRLDSDVLSALRLKQEFPMSLTVAGGHEAYKCKDALAAAKVAVLLAPLSTTPGNGPEGSETVLNNAGALHAAGVPFALTGGHLLDQARFAVRYGLPADAALASITAAPAKLLGVADRVGTIAAGKDADLVALTGDPFDLTTTVRWTMADGTLRPEDQ